MTYTNFPLYIGVGNSYFNDSDRYHVENMILAESVNVSYNTVNKPNRRLGRDIREDAQFLYDGDLICDISFNFVFYPKLYRGGEVYSFLFNGGDYDGYVVGNNTGQNFFPIRVGGNVFNKCFLESYQIDITANSPVVCSASFKSYDPKESGKLNSDAGFDVYNNLISGGDVVNAHNCELSGLYSDIVSSDVVPKVSYKRSFNRTPVYSIGQTKPNNFLINSADVSMDVESTGLATFFNYSGYQLTGDIGVNVVDSEGNNILPNYFGGYDLGVGSGAAISREDFSVNGGDTVVTKLNIKEVLL